MGFPDFFIFDWSLPSVAEMAGNLGWVARVLLHIAALIGLMA